MEHVDQPHEQSPPSALDRAIEAAGSMSELGRWLGLTPKAVRKWRLAGKLPRTEYTGETAYAAVIERQTQGRVTREQLLALRPSRQDGGGSLSGREAAVSDEARAA